MKTWFNYSDNIGDESIVAGFTNFKFPETPPDDRIEFARILGLDPGKIVKPKQVHSDVVKICNNNNEFLTADGIITTEKDLVLSIQVADCIPIFIYDNNAEIIGLVHAGWKGVAKGIITSTLNQLRMLKSDLRNIKFLLGPSIRQCCFEIGPDVSVLFDNKYQKSGKGDRSYLDLQEIVMNELKKNKVDIKNINDIKECTCCSDNYHSYRRSGKSAGRMIAMIGWKS